eukprot:m.182552 g.182552  ORF g.182552 m.182552 type:complete len:862 (+) comp39295_c0_seq18:55-2640(+)
MDEQDSPTASEISEMIELSSMQREDTGEAIIPMETNPIGSLDGRQAEKTATTRTKSLPMSSTLNRSELPSNQSPFRYQRTRKRRRSEASKQGLSVRPDGDQTDHLMWAGELRRRSDARSLGGNDGDDDDLTLDDLDEPGDEKLAPHILANKRRKELRRTTKRLTLKMTMSQSIKELELEQMEAEAQRMSQKGCSAFCARLRQWSFLKRNQMARAWAAGKYALRLWWKEKSIESRFGSGVVSYFVLLRWMLVINLLPLSGLWFFFVFIPQLAVKSSSSLPQPLESGNGTQLTVATLTGCLEKGLNFTLAENCTCGVSCNASGLFDCFVAKANANVAETTAKWYDYILSFFTGTGWLENTELFIGDYSGDIPDKSYQIPLAYILVGGIFYLTSLILLVVKVSAVYKQSYVEGFSTGARYPFLYYVFTAWDYTISNPAAAKEQRQIIKKHLEENLATIRKRSKAESRTTRDKWKIWTIRILCNILVVGMLVAAGAAIYYAAEVSIDAGISQVGLESFDFDLFIRQLAASLTISAFNVVYPFLFEIIVNNWEKYTITVYRTYLTILRSITLRAAGLIVLMVTLLRQLQCSQEILSCGTVISVTVNNSVANKLQSFVEQEKECKLCWETFVGQEVYRLLLVDFFFDIASTWLYQGLRNLASRLKFIRCVNTKAEFVLSKNVINLVFSQALIWIGAFFGPLIPLIGSVQFLLVYYAKKGSLILNCRPPSQAYRASRTSIFFLLLLLIALFACLIPVGYAIVKNQPSAICGPFRGLDSIYDVISNEIEKAPEWLETVLDYIGSAAVVVPLILFLCLLAFYFSSTSRAYKASIATLEDQLQMKGEDIKKLYEAANKEIMNLKREQGKLS